MVGVRRKERDEGDKFVETNLRSRYTWREPVLSLEGDAHISTFYL